MAFKIYPESIKQKNDRINRKFFAICDNFANDQQAENMVLDIRVTHGAFVENISRLIEPARRLDSYNFCSITAFKLEKDAVVKA